MHFTTSSILFFLLLGFDNDILPEKCKEIQQNYSAGKNKRLLTF